VHPAADAQERRVDSLGVLGLGDVDRADGLQQIDAVRFCTISLAFGSDAPFLSSSASMDQIARTERSTEASATSASA